MDKKLIFNSFRNTTLTAIYIFVVSQLMQNGDRLFGSNSNILGPLVILLLFSLSAAVVGGLIFGESIILLIDGKKASGIKSAIYSVGWLGVYTFLGIFVLALLK